MSDIIKNRRNLVDTYSLNGKFMDVWTGNRPDGGGVLKDVIATVLTGSQTRKDVLRSRLTVDTSATVQVSIAASCYPNTKQKPKKFTLYQSSESGNAVIATAGADGRFGNIACKSFRAGRPVLMSVTGENGKIIATQTLLISVVNSLDASQVGIPNSISIGDGIELTLNDGPLNGLKLKLPVCDFPVTSKIADDGKVQIGFNIDLGGNEDSQWERQFASTQSIRKLFSKAKKKVQSNPGKLGVNFVGYAEGDLSTGVVSGQVGVEISFKYSHETQHFIAFVPVVVEASGEIKGEVTGSAGRIYATSHGFEFGECQLIVEPSGSLGVYGGVGVAYVASLGAWGSGTFGGHVSILPNAYIQDLYLQGKAGIKALIFNKSYSLTLFGESDASKLYLYRRGSVGAGDSAPDAPNSELMAKAASDEGTPVGREYLASTTPWNGEVGNDGKATMQESVYPDAQVQAVDVRGGMLMAFLADDESRPDADRSRLMWTRYDAGMRTWSDPRPVWDDGTADLYPSLCQDGQGGAYVAWSNARGEIPQGASLSDEAALYDPSMAHFSAASGEMSDAGFVTASQDSYEAAIRVSAVGDSPVVAWHENALTDVLGLSGEHPVCVASRVAGSTEWDVRRVATAGGVVTGLAVGDAGGAAVAWAEDADGVLDTQADSSVRLWSAGASDASVVAEGAWNPRFATNGDHQSLVYGQGDGLFVRNADGTQNKVMGDLPYTPWQISGDLAGDALLTYAWYENGSGNIYGRASHGGEWGDREAILTQQGKSVRSWGTGFSNGQPSIVWAAATETGESSTDASLNCAVGNGLDALAIGEASYEDGKIRVSLSNDGVREISSYVLSVTEGDTTINTISRTAAIAAGATATAEIPVAMPNDGQAHTYVVRVTPSSLSGGSAEVTAGQPMLVMETEHVMIGTDEAVNVSVTNEGQAPSAAGKVMFYDAETGGILHETELEPVAGGETRSLTFMPGGMLADQSVSAVRICVEIADAGTSASAATDFVVAFGSYETEIDENAPGAEPIVFVDVNESTPHAEDIGWLAENGISTGWENGDGTRSFRPENRIARADMAAFMFRLASLWGVAPEKYEPSDEIRAMFADVTDETPHHDEIWWLAENGITMGWERPDGRREFRPFADVARADMAAFMFRLAGKAGIVDASAYEPQADTRRVFADTSESSPHARDIWWLAENEVSTGFVDARSGRKEFRGTDAVARCDMAAFLCRLNGLRG